MAEARVRVRAAVANLTYGLTGRTDAVLACSSATVLAGQAARLALIEVRRRQVRAAFRQVDLVVRVGGVLERRLRRRYERLVDAEAVLWEQVP